MNVKIKIAEELTYFTSGKNNFEIQFYGKRNIKDLIESLGIPHTEFGKVLVNGKEADNSKILCDNNHVEIFPKEYIKMPNFKIKFILDVHLGKLAKHLRFYGFDSYYRNNLDDEEIIRIAVKEDRIILTRDLGILKNNLVTKGYFVRNTGLKEQIKELEERFGLKDNKMRHARCPGCNSLIDYAIKEELKNIVPGRVYEYYDEFYKCTGCGKIYWKGSHYLKMNKLLLKG